MVDIPSPSLSPFEPLIELKNLRLALLAPRSLALASALHDAWSAVGYAWGCICGVPNPAGRAPVLAVYPAPLAGIDVGTELSISHSTTDLGAPPSLMSEPDPVLGLVQAFGLHRGVRLPLYDGRYLVGSAFLARSGEFSRQDAFDAERLLRPAGRLLHAAVEASEHGWRAAMDEAANPRTMASPPAAGREVIARLAHLLNNPLTSILGSSELLNQVDDLEREQLLTLIRSEARRAGRVLRDALDFSTPPAASLQVVELRALIREVTGSLQPSFAEQAASLHVALEDLVHVTADPRLFARALGLILGYGLDAPQSDRPSSLSVSLALMTEPNSATLSICIEPLTLSEQELAGMWEPIDAPPADRGEFRFELPLARLLLSSQGISLASEYQAERERLQFRLSLPLVPARAAAPPQPELSGGPIARLLIGSPPLRKLVELLLVRRGVTVQVSDSGERAEVTAEVDLMVIDESWAERSEAAFRFSGRWNAPLRVMVVGNSVPSGLPQHWQIKLLEIPFNLDTFDAALRRLCGPEG